MAEFEVRADGEPNFYTILRDGDWFARIQFNGEIFTQQQEAYMRRIQLGLGKPIKGDKRP